jgi:hypothetical protein
MEQAKRNSSLGTRRASSSTADTMQWLNLYDKCTNVLHTSFTHSDTG